MDQRRRQPKTHITIQTFSYFLSYQIHVIVNVHVLIYAEIVFFYWKFVELRLFTKNFRVRYQLLQSEFSDFFTILFFFIFYDSLPSVPGSVTIQNSLNYVLRKA